MLNQLFSNLDVLKRLTASSLGSLVQSYARFLHANKFSPSTMQNRIRGSDHYLVGTTLSKVSENRQTVHGIRLPLRHGGGQRRFGRSLVVVGQDFLW